MGMRQWLGHPSERRSVVTEDGHVTHHVFGSGVVPLKYTDLSIEF
jgi:hypothetical protein